MSIPLPVTKMHGTLNDFVIVDNRRAYRSIDVETIVYFPQFGSLKALGEFICDRHAAIGADGLLVIEDSEIADAKLVVINADGSEAEMCGNGIRCVVRYIAEKAGETENSTTDTVRIETLAGIIEASILAREPEWMIRAAIGIPAFEAATSLPRDAAVVSMGNPHVVIFEGSEEGALAQLQAVDIVSIAEPFQNIPLFPEGTNVHLAVATGKGGLTVRHWERGVGETMACGTGAVAAAAAAIRAGLAISPVEITVPGGRLTVEWDGHGSAYMTGPAIRVFDAELYFEGSISLHR